MHTASQLPLFENADAINKQQLEFTNSASQIRTIGHVPDQPAVPLQEAQVQEFLKRELETTDLDKMYGWLWLCAAKCGDRIDPLHRQVVKGRSVLVTEDPALHMVWFKNTVCIKPIPAALLNYDFWKQYLCTSRQQFDPRVALGFLRSYGYLIRHRSDLKIALDKELVPEGVKWEQWERFVQAFRSLDDCDVANRYHFGQFRLSRLNILIRFIRPRGSKGNNRHYFTMHWYTSVYLKQFVNPALFVFASVSLLLSAMQVILTLPSEIETRTWVRNSASMSFAFWGFCIFVLIGLGLSWLLLLVNPILYILAQQMFGYKQKRRFEKQHIRHSTDLQKKESVSNSQC